MPCPQNSLQPERGHWKDMRAGPGGSWKEPGVLSLTSLKTLSLTFLICKKGSLNSLLIVHEDCEAAGVLDTLWRTHIIVAIEKKTKTLL